MTKEQLAEEIYKRYGTVTRARGCFLYTKKGVRLTDMYLEDGRAILGWEGGASFTQLKNFLSRGLTGSFITEDVSRLNKAVSRLFGSARKILCFSSKMDALKATLSISKESSCFWKPFSNSEVNYSDVDSITFIPPLPWTDSFYLLAVKSELFDKCDVSQLHGLIKLPFAVTAAITRSIYDLIAELPQRQEKHWFIYDTVLTKYWNRNACYLMPKIPEEKYDEFVIHCLENHLVINPAYDVSIVPFGADKGNFNLIKNSPFAL